jgi:hypothetical protein
MSNLYYLFFFKLNEPCSISNESAGSGGLFENLKEEKKNENKNYINQLPESLSSSFIFILLHNLILGFFITKKTHS